MVRRSSAAALSLCIIFAGHSAFADQTNIEYEVLRDPSSPLYESALGYLAQTGIYDGKGLPYRTSESADWSVNPFIGVGTADLNGGAPETVVYPVEISPQDDGLLCPFNEGCPHLIFGKSASGNDQLLGIISAHSLAIDDSSINGYRRLRAYTQNPETNPGYYELYQYDAQKKSYVKLEP